MGLASFEEYNLYLTDCYIKPFQTRMMQKVFFAEIALKLFIGIPCLGDGVVESVWCCDTLPTVLALIHHLSSSIISTSVLFHLD